MANYLQHFGLELPVYETDDVLCLTDQFKEAAAQGRERFVRTAELFNDDGRTLSQRLTYADACFRLIEDLCDVQVVDYTWGLCKDRWDIAYRRRFVEHLLPKGYLLVVEVDAVREQPMSIERLRRYHQGELLLHEWQRTIPPEAGRYYEDYDAGQVIYGTLVREPQAAPNMYFVDVEPIILDPPEEQ